MAKPNSTIRVAVSGACGRMGREVVNTLLHAGEDIELVGVADPARADLSLSQAIGIKSTLTVQKTIHTVLDSTSVDAVVVFTTPDAAMENIRATMKAGAVPVVGTTGITPENLSEIRKLASEHNVGAIIAPNFAIGAVLMMRIAQEIAKYLPDVEIIELHHPQKVDAPSGTAKKTAELIAEAISETSHTNDPNPARGSELHGIRIHSVRLPGLVAHQEVIFGGPGQTLTIRHDSYDRKSFMPGVLFAIRKTPGLKEVIYGLEKLI